MRLTVSVLQLSDIEAAFRPFQAVVDFYDMQTRGDTARKAKDTKSLMRKISDVSR